MNAGPLRAASQNSITAWAAPLKRAGWERNGPIRPHPYSALAAAGGRNDHAASPDGSSWAFSRVVEDSGEIELFVVGPDGQPRRLTFAPGDDGGPTWSPDGRFLAFATNRWNIAAANFTPRSAKRRCRKMNAMKSRLRLPRVLSG